jgi:hypothetical protein
VLEAMERDGACIIEAAAERSLIDRMVEQVAPFIDRARSRCIAIVRPGAR